MPFFRVERLYFITSSGLSLNNKETKPKQIVTPNWNKWKHERVYDL